MIVEGNSSELQPTPEELRQLARSGVLNVEALERALKIAGYTPDTTQWLRFLDILLLALGAGLTISGIFFFFAFNWANMHRFLKLGSLEAAVFLAVGLAFWRKLDSLSGKIALGAAGLLTGALLAVYGQIYQTGADSYQLFLFWALLITGWVVIGRFTPLWVVWVLLLNLGLVLYWAQIMGGMDSRLFLCMFCLNGSAVLVWELAHAHGVAWLKNRWAPRLLVLPAFAALVVAMVELIFGSAWQWSHDSLSFLIPVLYIGASTLVLYVYSRKTLDLFMLTVCAFSLIIVLDAWVIKVLESLDEFLLLLMSAMLVGEAALVVTWLRKVSRS